MSDFYLNPSTNNESVITNIGRTIRALDPEKKWHVVIKLFKKNRSLDQNAYYWSVMMPCIVRWHHETQGVMVTEQAAHEELKKLYCPYSVEQGLSGVQKIYKSTTKLSTVEFNDMTDRMISDFAEMGCHIPPPDKHWKSRKAA